MPFLCIHISHGSVATRLKRGGIFKHEFITNLLPSQLVKKLWKSGISWWSYGQEFGVLFFSTHGVVLCSSWRDFDRRSAIADRASWFYIPSHFNNTIYKLSLLQDSSRTEVMSCTRADVKLAPKAPKASKPEGIEHEGWVVRPIELLYQSAQEKPAYSCLLLFSKQCGRLSWLMSAFERTLK